MTHSEKKAAMDSGVQILDSRAPPPARLFS
jgi:hypothetical protein